MLTRHDDGLNSNRITCVKTKKKTMLLSIIPDEKGNINAELKFRTQLGCTFFYFDPRSQRKIESEVTTHIHDVTVDLSCSGRPVAKL